MNKIAFIGGGSMAEAMISGITSRGVIEPPSIFVTNKDDDERLNFLQKTYGVSVTLDKDELLKNADIVVLAVKPKDVFNALTSVKDYLTENMLLISVAAGVSITSIENIIEQKIAIIRSMPNTSATVGLSATAVSMNSLVTEKQLEKACRLFETIGIVTTVEEEQLDAVTGLSGSGPAYIYYLVEAMEQSALETGLQKDIAKKLIVQTLLGAAQMLQTSTKEPQILRKEVTSPGGTTEAGLKVLHSHKVQEAFVSCIKEATRQSKRLGEQLSNEIQAKTALTK
ncbi:pyrroline-5-carboxylate reductase [Peribacillus tepidiphilus]|jgi:pyrroline-5-carboxylate reductase|uniref:pyrroline-5-carboxylate reductase n=1 Tax=Peribacillus tepidiphilus TaxID=2652445 RepID=UPI001291DC92|nr:pyrroline-5-carboxylate reductase [Peribacillus tepidiphilus]